MEQMKRTLHSWSVGLGAMAMFTTAVLASGTTSVLAKGNSDLKGTINVWSFYPMANVIGPFEKEYPGIKVKFTNLPYTNYIQKLQAALQTGVNVPDAFALEVGFEQEFINLPQLQNLSEAPYNANQYLKGQFPYVGTMSKDSSGNVKALTFQATPGGIWYRRDLAKKYFGTGDPSKISAMISTWPKIMKLGAEVYRKSGGHVHLFAGASDFENIMNGAVRTPWVKDNKLTIDKARLKGVQLARQGFAGNIDAKLDNSNDTTGIAAAIKDGTVLMLAEPAWYLEYDIMADGPNTKGKWGLASSPIPFWGGGTWWGISSNSPQKDLAWAFVKFYSTDKQFLVNYMKSTGDFTSSIKADERLAKSYKQPFLGGENSMALLTKVAKTIHTAHATPYDVQIGTMWGNDMLLYIEGKKTLNQALQTFKNDVHNAFPNISV